MAIMHQESHFQAGAEPIKAKIFGVFAVHPSSAVGYSQAVNQTWRLYLKATHQFSADRENFASATDFIGWFSQRAHEQLGLAKNDTYRLYLAYHEGLAGYRMRDYKDKHWLKAIAHRVAAQAKRYQYQLLRCEGRLNARTARSFSAAPSSKLLNS